MKTSKRILSSLLLIVFTIVSFATVSVSATTFADVKAGSDVEEAVTVLSGLGVINGYEESDGSFTFKPENNVTRAEFTAMLLRTCGKGSLGSTDLKNPPFPDVTTPNVAWAIGNIRTARDLGIINGYDDGTFRPTNTVSYEEAVKMIVCALGYGNMGTDGTPWYSKYIKSASQLKFTDNAGGKIGTPATRETIAKMLYNCLEVKVAENDEITEKTLLEADLGLTKAVGFIASNPEISLSTPDAKLRADEIQITAPEENGRIETMTYKVDDIAKYADMLGAQITFYYQNDRGASVRKLVMANVEKSVVVEVAADQIDVDESSASSVSFFESETAKKATVLRVASDSIVVYNGQLYGADAESSTFEIFCDEMGAAAFPAIGTMKFLDRNADKSYDIVFVDSYEAYIVSSVTSSTKTIVDNNLRKGVENKIVIDPDDTSKKVKIVDKNGKEVPFSTIKVGSVVCVKASNEANGGEQVMTAVVCNDTVSGTVKGVNSDDTIKIDGKTYKFSELAPWISPIEGAEVVMTQPEMGDGGKFYLDLNGNIIGYDKKEQTSNMQYGYLMTARTKKEALEEICVLNFITQSGSKTSYYVYDKTKLNGKVYGSYDSLLSALEDTAAPSGFIYPEPSDLEDDEDFDAEENHKMAQLVKFSTKSNKGQLVIDEIITVTDYVTSGRDQEADKIFFFEAMDASEAVTYNSTNKQLIGDKKINIGSSVIFKIPEDRSDVDKYKKMSLNDFRNGEEYIVEFYDVTGTNTAKFVLVYGGAKNAGEVVAESPVMVITEINTEEDPEGNGTRYKLVGYVGSSAVEYWGSTESDAVFADLQAGDVVRLGTDDEGYYTVKAEHVIFSVEDGYRDDAIDLPQEADDDNVGEYPKDVEGSTGSVAFKLVWGSAYQRDSELLIVSTNAILDGSEDEDSIESITMQRSWFKNAKIFEFDTTGRELEITEYDTSENESVIDALDLYDSGATPAELFIHMSSKTAVKTVIIVRR